MRLIFVFILSITLVSTHGSNASFDKLFSEHSIIDLQLLFPVEQLNSDQDKSVFYDVEIKYKTEESAGAIQAKISRGGDFRNDPEHCIFPPLRLKFDSTKVKHSIFEGLTKVKLLSHCFKIGEASFDYLFREYLVYRLYQIISPYSFKSRLVRIQYVDSGSQDNTISAYAVLVQDDDDLAKQHNGIVLKVHNLHPNFIADTSHALISIFQYMIGNTDWSIKTLHNIKLLSVPGSKPIPVPYDFDFCGFVNSPLASPPTHIPINRVTERFYTSHCFDESLLRWTLSYYREKSDEIYMLLSDFQLSREQSLQENKAFLADFFHLIDDTERAVTFFMTHCRKDDSF